MKNVYQKNVGKIQLLQFMRTEMEASEFCIGRFAFIDREILILHNRVDRPGQSSHSLTELSVCNVNVYR